MVYLCACLKPDISQFLSIRPVIVGCCVGSLVGSYVGLDVGLDVGSVIGSLAGCYFGFDVYPDPVYR